MLAISARSKPLWLRPASSAPFHLHACTEMTEHATTNIGVIEQFLPVRFDFEPS